MKWWGKRRPPSDVLAVAAHWVVELEDGELSASRRADLDRWLAADPMHRQAIDQAAATLELAARHAGAPEIMVMREAALRAGTSSRSASLAWAAGIASVSILLAALWMRIEHSEIAARPAGEVTQVALAAPKHFSTEVGERATISLPDGSTATLDTQSALEVDYTDSERGIRLLRGQALFEVAKHKAIPFQVYAGGRRITAIGTLFNVRIDGQRLRVALIEGKVRVVGQQTGDSDSGPVPQVTLSPGDILDTAGATLMSVKVGDLSRAVSWRDGVSAFVDTPLADVALEMNRYTIQPIVIDDPALGSLRISGVFKTGDPERFAESVAKIFPITIEQREDGNVALRFQLKEK